jgi:hypothetical protein
MLLLTKRKGSHPNEIVYQLQVLPTGRRRKREDAFIKMHGSLCHIPCRRKTNPLRPTGMVQRDAYALQQRLRPVRNSLL